MRFAGPALCVAGLLPLCGCLFAPAIKNGRSLARSERTFRYTAAYWSVESTRHSEKPAVTSSYGSGSYAPVHESSTARVWNGALDGRIGTLVDGLDMGFAVHLAGAVSGDLNYQFLGFGAQPEGLAMSLGGQATALLNGGFGMAADLTLGQRFGIADLSLGGRFGNISGSQDYGYYYSGYSYYGSAYAQAPSHFSYFDLYAGSELHFFSRASLSFGAAMRQFTSRSYYNYRDYNDMPVEVSYPATYYFMLSLRSYHGGRIAKAAREAKAEQRRKRRQRLMELEEQDRVLNAPEEAPLLLPGQDGPGYDELLKNAKAALKRGDFSAALSDFKATEAFQRPDFEVLMSQGYCHYMLKDWKSSLEAYERALIHEPGNERLRRTVEELRRKSDP